MTKQPKWHLPSTDIANLTKTWCGRDAESVKVVDENDYENAINNSVLADGREVCEACRNAYDFGG